MLIWYQNLELIQQRGKLLFIKRASFSFSLFKLFVVWGNRKNFKSEPLFSFLLCFLNKSNWSIPLSVLMLKSWVGFLARCFYPPILQASLDDSKDGKLGFLNTNLSIMCDFKLRKALFKASCWWKHRRIITVLRLIYHHWVWSFVKPFAQTHKQLQTKNYAIIKRLEIPK